METVQGLFLHSFDDIFSYIRLSFSMMAKLGSDLNEMDNIFIEYPTIITENVRLKYQKVVSEKMI